MKYIILVFVYILFLGCSNTVEPKSEYRINSKIQTKLFSQKGCKAKSLKIAQAFSSKTLLSQDMNYALGDSNQYVYASALWVRSPNRAITTSFLSVIRDSKLFKNVQISKSRSKSDWILEINIEDFMQYFNEDSTLSYANVVISLSLMDSRTNLVFASETFKSKIDVKTLDSVGGVNALNSALNSILTQNNIWLAKVCK